MVSIFNSPQRLFSLVLAAAYLVAISSSAAPPNTSTAQTTISSSSSLLRDLQEDDCVPPPQGEVSFETFIMVNIRYENLGANRPLNSGDWPALSDIFVEAINGITQCAQRGAYRTTTDAEVLPEFVDDQGNQVSIVFQTRGTCLGCTGSSLFALQAKDVYEVEDPDEPDLILNVIIDEDFNVEVVATTPGGVDSGPAETEIEGVEASDNPDRVNGENQGTGDQDFERASTPKQDEDRKLQDNVDPEGEPKGEVCDCEGPSLEAFAAELNTRIQVLLLDLTAENVAPLGPVEDCTAQEAFQKFTTELLVTTNGDEEDVLALEQGILDTYNRINSISTVACDPKKRLIDSVTATKLDQIILERRLDLKEQLEEVEKNGRKLQDDGTRTYLVDVSGSW